MAKRTLNDVLSKKSVRAFIKGRLLSQEDLKSYTANIPEKKTYGVEQLILRKDFNDFIQSHNKPNPIVVDLGSYNRRFYGKSINVDIVQEGDTDLVWDLTKKLPIKSSSVDFVACTAVLEHVNDPEQLISEIYRILKPGGRAWLDIPFLQPYHESPDDYYRYTLSGIKHKMREFKLIKSGAIPGMGFSLQWIVKEFKAVLEWEKLLDAKKYPHLSKLLKGRDFKLLCDELINMDNNFAEDFKDGLPFSFHIVANGVFVYCEKPKQSRFKGLR